MQTNVSDFGLPNTRRSLATIPCLGRVRDRLPWKLYTLFRTEGPKTIPYPAARPRKAHIGEYPPPPGFHCSRRLTVHQKEMALDQDLFGRWHLTAASQDRTMESIGNIEVLHSVFKRSRIYLPVFTVTPKHLKSKQFTEWCKEFMKELKKVSGVGIVPYLNYLANIPHEFIELSTETPYLCPSEGHKHSGRKSNKTSGIHFCWKGKKLVFSRIALHIRIDIYPNALTVQTATNCWRSYLFFFCSFNISIFVTEVVLLSRLCKVENSKCPIFKVKEAQNLSEEMFKRDVYSSFYDCWW